MSAAKPVDLSRVVVILGSFVGVDDVLGLSENSRYEFLPPTDGGDSWKGGQSAQELEPPLLCLTIGKHMFDPRGWVGGSHSDSDMCDLQLAVNNQTGISRRFIRFDISPVTHKPRVTVLSDKKIRIWDGDSFMTCRSGQPTEFSRPVTIDLGAVRFRAWPPLRTAAEGRKYKRRAAEFSEDILRAVPKYLPSISSQPETAGHNVRYGRHGAVYVNELGLSSRGMCASVMMVEDRTTGRVFGAKEPYYKTSDSADAARKRFEALQREYEHIIQLEHPHIVKAYDLVLAEDVTLPPWMIVEYIPLNLREALADLDKGDRPTVLTHLLSALHHMHMRGITHRDVKPDNALVQRRGQEFTVKLADFGTSKHDAAGGMDTFTGTEIYMAPELFEKPRRYTNKVDMWAIGLIGMGLFTSWDPATDDEWDPGDFGPWMRNVILPHVAEAPEHFRPLLKGLLRKNPEKRWNALKCLKWLWKPTWADHDLAGIDEQTGTGEMGAITRKRAASTTSEDLFKADGHERRNPGPNTRHARVYTVPPAKHHSDESTLPDTLSPGFLESEPISVPSTPFADEGLSDEVDEEDEECGDGSDTDLDYDWREDGGQAKKK
ncbi:Phosphoenolpyruvate carboxylase kinase [Pleurostoma richardsiae]|uniref:Phosphoenolpyruvate carboxylase kinase n=1 Tax=Pleurostoma richardsiae TaxID=41990 RepID=A0AA38VFN1_9PEZI|nr:Phosphoenolpyruvate carboxylase kinase [Pleurostoma richardsiae]